METMQEMFSPFFKSSVGWLVLACFVFAVVFGVIYMVHTTKYAKKWKQVQSNLEKFELTKEWAYISPGLFDSTAFEGACDGEVIVHNVDGGAVQYAALIDTGPFVVSPGSHTIILSVRTIRTDLGQAILQSGDYKPQQQILGPWALEISVEKNDAIALLIDAGTQEMVAYRIPEEEDEVNEDEMSEQVEITVTRYDSPELLESVRRLKTPLYLGHYDT